MTKIHPFDLYIKIRDEKLTPFDVIDLGEKSYIPIIINGVEKYKSECSVISIHSDKFIITTTVSPITNELY